MSSEARQNMLPSLSVIIPAYNAGKFIRRTLQSVEGQVRQPDEIIVIDDGSTDETARLVEEFAETCALRIKLKRQENQGSSAARNHGIGEAGGELLAFLDADDVIYPDFLNQAVLALSHYPHWLACFSDRDIVDDKGTLIAKDLDHPVFRSISKRRLASDFVELSGDTLFVAMLDGSVIPMTIVCRRRDVEAVGGFDETLVFNEDRLFMLRMMKRGVFGYVDRPLGTWQRHSDNKSNDANALRQHVSSELILKKVLSDREALHLSTDELSSTKLAQQRLARSWVYASSSRGSDGTLALIRKMRQERRISRLFAAKAISRHFYSLLSGHLGTSSN